MHTKSFYLVLAIILCAYFHTNGQTYVKKHLAPGFTRIETYKYIGDDGLPLSYMFEFVGLNRKDSGTELLIAFRGTASEMHEFLSALLEFSGKFKEHEIAGTHIDGMRVERSLRRNNDNMISIYPKGGYIKVFDSEVTDLIGRLELFCREENIEI